MRQLRGSFRQRRHLVASLCASAETSTDTVLLEDYSKLVGDATRAMDKEVNVWHFEAGMRDGIVTLI